MKKTTLHTIKQLTIKLLIAGISLAGIKANAQTQVAYSSEPQVTEANFINNILIYPNPTQNNVIIKSDIIVPSTIRIIITDILGRTQFERDENVTPGLYEHQFNLSDKPNGVYLMEIRIGDQVITRRFVKD